MSAPGYDEIEKILSEAGVTLAWWQKAAVHSIAGGHGLSTFPVSTGRGYGKWIAERWGMFAAHSLGQHVHWAAGDQFPERPGICTAPKPACLEAGWTPYDPVEMKP